jgi:hypothetical protein
MPVRECKVTLVVQRNVNLRADPSTGMPPITLLMPPAVLTLVAPERQSGYYHLRTDAGQEGWAWAKNVELVKTPVPSTRLGPTELYPDSVRTPGYANPDITQDNIAENLCSPTWSTRTIRPPTSYTNPLKLKQMAAYGDSVSDPTGACVLWSATRQII